MPDTLFQGIFDTERTAVIAPEQFLLCVGASLVIGLVLCAMMLWHTRPSAGFAVTLATLPAVVCVVIMMVNGNVGTGVAVAGAFSLVRFRSAPVSYTHLSARSSEKNLSGSLRKKRESSARWTILPRAPSTPM